MGVSDETIQVPAVASEVLGKAPRPTRADGPRSDHEAFRRVGPENWLRNVGMNFAKSKSSIVADRSPVRSRSRYVEGVDGH